MTVSAPRFEWSFNFGHVLQTGTIFLSIIGMIWWQSGWQTSITKDVEESKVRAASYIPRLESLERSDKIQDERIGNLSDAVKEARQANTAALRDIGVTNSSVALTLTSIKEDIAGIKAQLRISDRRPP